MYRMSVTMITPTLASAGPLGGGGRAGGTFDPEPVEPLDDVRDRESLSTLGPFSWFVVTRWSARDDCRPGWGLWGVSWPGWGWVWVLGSAMESYAESVLRSDGELGGRSRRWSSGVRLPCLGRDETESWNPLHLNLDTCSFLLFCYHQEFLVSSFMLQLSIFFILTTRLL